MLGKIIEFELKDGSVISLEMTSRLVEDIMSTFSLQDQNEMTTNHVRHYLISGMERALGTQDVES